MNSAGRGPAALFQPRNTRFVIATDAVIATKHAFHKITVHSSRFHGREISQDNSVVIDDGRG